MQIANAAWYCARTKPKHEHLAAAHLRKNLNLEVFNPRLHVERATQRGLMRVHEPLFPGYVFVRCVLQECLDEIQYTNGIHSLVHYGRRIPSVADSIIEELQECFGAEDTLSLQDRISPGDHVSLGEGVFAGMHACVLRLMPARYRVQVLLDIMGAPTPVEVDRSSVLPVKCNLAELVPMLAAPIVGLMTV